MKFRVRTNFRWDGECRTRRGTISQTHPLAASLDLFSGTGSTAEAFKEQGFEVITLGFKAKYRPDILVDILDWDYEKAFTPGYFHTISVSPPCTEYSAAMTCRPRELAKAEAFV